MSMDDMNDFSLRRRTGRAVHLDPEIPCFLLCPELGSRPIPVLDISELGTRFALESLPASPRPGGQYLATLQLDQDFRCEIRIRVAYLDARVAGVEFVDPPKPFVHLIRAFFRHELLGANLRLLRDAGRRDVLRFSDHGPNWVEIFLEDGPGEKTPRGLVADLTSFGAHVKWSTELPHLIITQARKRSRNPVNEELGPREFIRVIRNIPELDAALASRIEKIALGLA